MDLQLHDYQELARDFLRGRPRGGLFLDMGLGKTAASLSALEKEHLPVVVVAPKRVAETVWGPETALWRPDLSFALAAGSPAQRMAVLASGADIIALGRDNIKDLETVRPARPWSTLLLDELSGFKSNQSVRWKTAKKVIASTNIPHVWGLTGTPAPNGLMDLWAPVYLMDQGKRLGSTLTGFRNRFFYPGRRLPNGVVIEWIPHPGAREKIFDLIDDLFLSMGSEGRIELPPLTHNTVTVELPPEVVRLYRTLKKDMIADLKEIFGDDQDELRKVLARNAAVLSGKLSQICSGFLYDQDELGNSLSTYRVLHWEKVRAVQEIIDGSGSPVLVFYQFRAELEMLRKELKGARLISETGAIDEWNRGDVRVLLAHPESAGHGLNLQHGGHTIVWASLPWNLEHWQQANKRLLRQGQRNPVVIHQVRARGSVDGIIADRLDGKTNVQQSLLDHLESPL